MTDRIPSADETAMRKTPVSFGEVGGMVHAFGSSRKRDDNSRSSSEGKEQTRSKISESGKERQTMERDRRVGDIPCKGTKAPGVKLAQLAPMCRRSRYRKAQIQSYGLAENFGMFSIERLRV